MANRRSLYGADRSNFLNHILRTPTSFSFASPSSPSFFGSRSLLSFGDVNGRSHLDKSFVRHFDRDEFGDEDFDEYSLQPEKKRRLTADQIQFLEKSFEVENKLEPDRKLKLAKDIGLQPRQVAVWFQNRRARWKTKTLERDYLVLQDSYNNLKAKYDDLLRDNEKLKSVVFDPTYKLLSQEKEKGSSELVAEETIAGALQQERIRNNVSDYKAVQDSVEACKQEDLNSANSDVFDSDSPHHSNGFFSLLEPVDSYQSVLSQDQENKLNNNLLPSLEFLKNGDDNYPDMPANSCYFGFQVEEDQAFGLWAS